jgi:hypothetical protein
LSGSTTDGRAVRRPFQRIVPGVEVIQWLERAGCGCTGPRWVVSPACMRSRWALLWMGDIWDGRMRWESSSLVLVLISRIRPVPAISRTSEIPAAAARFVGKFTDTATSSPVLLSSRGPAVAAIIVLAAAPAALIQAPSSMFSTSKHDLLRYMRRPHNPCCQRKFCRKLARELRIAVGVLEAEKPVLIQAPGSCQIRCADSQ